MLHLEQARCLFDAGIAGAVSRHSQLAGYGRDVEKNRRLLEVDAGLRGAQQTSGQRRAYG